MGDRAHPQRLRKVPAEAFHRRFDIGPGSLHDTLTHVIGVTRTWTDTLAGQEARPRLETDGQRRMPEQLRALLAESWREFAAAARSTKSSPAPCNPADLSA